MDLISYIKTGETKYGTKFVFEAGSVLNESDVDEDKVHVLLKFLDLDSTPENFDRVSVASYNDNVYTIDGVDFLVCTDDEADAEFETAIDNFIDDVGIEGFTPLAQEYILENCIDEDPIIDFYQDSTRSYANDIYTETDPITIEVEGPDGDSVEVECTNRLFKECIENDIISEDDFSVEDFDEDGDYVGDKDLVELYCDHFDNPTVQGYDDAYDWLKWNFGASEASDFVKEHCSLDVEAVAEYIKSEDGRGNELNYWDGKEYEEDFDGETYFIYPTDDWRSIK
jgi:hypothetical protein